MKILVLGAARPNFVKIAPILEVLDERKVTSVLVHTGQHYDDSMSHAFFRDLEMRVPDYQLGVGSGSHAVQTAHVMERFELVLLEERPDWVLVTGDVNSTLAGALVTAKLRPSLGCRLAHIEAGLRSHDCRMPEEVNRVLTDRLSDLLCTPSRDAETNLRAEGIPEEHIRFVGNVMIDTLMNRLALARERPVIGELGLVSKTYAAATVHRPSNVDDRANLIGVLRSLGAVAQDRPVLFPLHPRTAASVERHGLEVLLEPLNVTGPIGYLDMLALMDGSIGVLTDSGGIQEETTALGIPCVTLREQTERPITIEEGTNRLAWPVTPEVVLETFRHAVSNEAAAGPKRLEGWDGCASQRIVAAIETHGR